VLALRDRARTRATGDLTAETRGSALGEAWHAGLTDLSPTNMQAYRDRLDRQIVPGLAGCGRELSIGVLGLSRRCRSRSSGSVPFRRVGAGCRACRPRRLRSRHG
jgi:hypothetical protein